MRLGLAIWLIGLNPRWWRDRYGAEMLALVEDTGLSARGAFDLLRHCLGIALMMFAVAVMVLGFAIGMRPEATSWFERVVTNPGTLLALSTLGLAFPAPRRPRPKRQFTV